MAPFYYDEDYADGYSKGLTPLIIRMSTIAVVVASFFQSGNSSVETIATLVLAVVLFEVTAKLTQFLGKVLKQRFVTAIIYKEETMEYQWIMTFLIQKQIFQDAIPHLNRAHGLPRRQRSRSFWWHGSWVEVMHCIPDDDRYVPYGESRLPSKSEIDITVYSLWASPTRKLLEEAKSIFLSIDRQEKVAVYSLGQESTTTYPPNSTPSWSERVDKPVHPMDSTSLSVDALTSLVEESAKFWESEAWYNEVGLPFRKGFLLHGPSGSGKRDAVYTVAGKLGRAVYSICASSVRDSSLLKVVSSVPKGSILLLENIEKGFTSNTPSNVVNGCYTGCPGPYDTQVNVKCATQSGIIQMLDTVAREDGVLFFATTSTLDNIDSALFQPGRIDKTIDFGYISKNRANAIFKRFFPNSDAGLKPTGLYDGYTDDVKYALPLDLAEQFSSQIPDNEFTINDIRFYLMSHQSSPDAAVSGVTHWIDAKREEKAKNLEAQKLASEQAKQAARIIIPAIDEQWSPFPLPPQPLIVSQPMSDTAEECEFVPNDETEEQD